MTNRSIVPRVSIVSVHADASPGIAHAEFRVTRSNTDSSNALTVNLLFTQGESYLESTSATIEISAGDTEGMGKFPSYYTGNTGGSLTATVASGTGYTPAIAPANAATVQMKVPASGRTLTISHAQSDYTVTEGEVLTVQVNFTTGTGVAQPREDVPFAVDFMADSATAPDDYPEIPQAIGSHTITPGDWSASGTAYTELWSGMVTIVDDTKYEGSEDFTFGLAQLAGTQTFFYPTCSPGTQSQGGRFCDVPVTITDNDTLGVTGVEVTSTPTGGYYNSGEAITFEATFNGSVTVDTTNGTPRFAFDVGGQTRYANYASGSPSTELTFSYTVASSDEDNNGISWAANALDRNGGTIKFTTTVVADREDASLAHAAQSDLSAHKVDTRKPTLTSATVNATTMKLEFSEELNTTAPALSQFSGKKTPDGESETDLAFTGTPSIASNTVTLTLATASSVVATDTDIKVSYSKPSSNPIKDLAGHEADAFSDKAVGNQLADSVAPELHGTTGPTLASDGRTLTITFNEAMNESSTPAASAFAVKATPQGDSEQTDLATNATVTVEGSTVKLVLAKPIAHNDGSVKVSYAKPQSGAVLEDANGNDLATFGDQNVTNGSLIPRVSISTTQTEFTPGLANGWFRVTRSNTSSNFLDVNYTISGVSSGSGTIEIDVQNTGADLLARYSGNTSGAYTITITGGNDHLPALAPNNSATLQVRVPASGRYATISHRETSHSVTEGNSVSHTVDIVAHAGVVRPRNTVGMVVVSQQGTATVSVDFTPVSEQLTVAPGDWTARGSEWVASKTFTVTSIDEMDGVYEGPETFELMLSKGLGTPSTVDVAPGTATATVTINDSDTLGVTDVAVTSTPTGGYYNSGEAITFEATFNGSVTVDTTNGTPRFAFDIGGQTRYATYTSGSPSTELTFSYTVAASDEDHDGISWAANALDRNGGTIKFTTTVVADREDASLAHAAQGALSAHKVDAKKPTLVSATVNATTMTLVFSEDLNTTAPALAQFSGKKTPRGGSETDLAFTGTPSINGSTVTLTLASGSSVTAADTDVKVSYTKPSNNPIQDLGGNEADAFTDFEVLNALADNTTPTLHGTTTPVLAADGRTLTITFSEAMDTSSTPAATAFTVKATPQGGSEQTDLATDATVTVEGSTVRLVLAKPIAHNDASVKVNYSKPGSGSVLQDANRNELATFGDQAVTNGSVIPRVSISAVHSDATPVIAHMEFRVTRSNTDSSNALTVNVDIDHKGFRRSDATDRAETIVIAAGATSATKEFPAQFDLNAPGNVAATVEGGDDHLPALAPNNEASVQMKVPASGRSVTVSHQQGAYTVEEGDTLTVTVTFATAAGVAQPRESVAYLLSTEQDTAVSNQDYTAKSAQRTLPSSAWTEDGGVYTATATETFDTIDDSIYEGSLQFKVELGMSPIGPVCPPGTADGTFCEATVTITDDEEEPGGGALEVGAEPDGGGRIR